MNPFETLPIARTRLRCIQRHEETPDCVTLRWAPDTVLDFKPGQFVSLEVPVDGQSLLRAYTIASSPTQRDYLEITVKRVEGGRVSNAIVDQVKVGDELNALSPTGSFYLDPQHLPPRLVLLSAGCGITPMLSMTRYLLSSGNTLPIHFIHSARNRENSIAYAELEGLAAEHPNLDLRWCWSENGQRLDVEQLPSLIPSLQDAEVFTCGPVAYMNQIATTLQQAGLPAEKIHLEDFGPVLPSASTATSSYRAHASRYDKTAEVKPGQSLLDALEAEQLPIIGACRSGVCGSCKCKVTAGKVETSRFDTLTEQEISEGYVLACSTFVQSDVAVEW